jgi:hypothetical protein
MLGAFYTTVLYTMLLIEMAECNSGGKFVVSYYCLVVDKTRIRFCQIL